MKVTLARMERPALTMTMGLLVSVQRDTKAQHVHKVNASYRIDWGNVDCEVLRKLENPLYSTL